jgi:hypothetical protein
MKTKRLSKLQIVSLEKAKRTAILAAIEVTNGDVSLAAKRLEIGKTTLYNKLKKYRVRSRRLAELRDSAALMRTLRSRAGLNSGNPAQKKNREVFL